MERFREKYSNLLNLGYFSVVMKNRINAACSKLALTSVFIGMLVLAAPGEAQAHARLIKSSPASGADLAQPPDKIELWFNELLDGNFDFIAVFPAADVGSKTRVSLVSEDAKVDDKDRTHLTVVIKALRRVNTRWNGGCCRWTAIRQRDGSSSRSVPPNKVKRW
jgi:methionine-rich copper-binding protein CopC